jgi:hypothetical protein
VFGSISIVVEGAYFRDCGGLRCVRGSGSVLTGWWRIGGGWEDGGMSVW